MSTPNQTQIETYFPNTDTNVKWQSGFFCVAHVHVDDIHARVKNWTRGYYLLSKEIANDAHWLTKGEHYHVVAQMTNDDWHSLSSAIKNKYKLNGKAVDGVGRQYGKVKCINDVEKMITYCMKDKDYETNLPSEEVIRLEDKSFKPPDASTYQQTLVNTALKPKKKKQVPWVQTVVDELLEKYKDDPDHDFSIRTEADFDFLKNFLFNRLGESAKAFDAMVFERLFNGVYNKLPKSHRAQQDFRDHMTENLKKKFLPY